MYREALPLFVLKGRMGGKVWGCHDRPSEAHRFGFHGLQAALQAAPFACLELSTICHLRRRLARPHISATRLFVHFHPTNPQIPPSHPKQKEHSLLVLASVHTIINFATKFFEMFTKKQSEHPQKVFRVFQVFQVFHFAFGPQNSPILVQIRTNPKNRHPPASVI